MTDLPIVEATTTPEVEPGSEKMRILGTISRLLAYPGEHYDQLIELLYLMVQGELSEAAKGISEFGQFVEKCEEHELEEAYTRTFDVNPSCALEIGWHLFGEDYMRGQFLVKMRSELAKYEIPESTELPDHLTHVLAVVAMMPDEEAQLFSHACIFPALHKMQTSLDKNESPYRHVIRCLMDVLEQQYGTSEPWGENEDKVLRNSDAFPGQNGPRQPGADDPLRSYPMPTESCGGGTPCGSEVNLVPLKIQYETPEPIGTPGPQDGRVK